METAYDLFKRLLGVMADIDRNLDEKSKTDNNKRIEILDKKIDSLEAEMFDLKNKLKNIELK